MTDSDPTSTTAELIAALNEVGCQVTSGQLKRWSRAGALPRPTQRHQPGYRGSETVWPDGIADQVAAVAGHARRLRSLEPTLIATWWDGWPVDTDLLLEVLANRIEAHPVWAVDDSGDVEERLDALDKNIRTADLARVRGPIAKALRRAGRSDEDRRSLLFVLGSIKSGIEPPLEAVDVGLDEPSVEDVLGRGLALDRFAAQLSEVGDSVTTSDLVRDAAGIAGLLGPMAKYALEVVESGNVPELAAARDDARALGLLPQLAAAILQGDPANGFGLVAELAVDLNDPDGWLLVLVLTLWLRAAMPENVASLASALARSAQPAAAFCAVLDGVPDLRELITRAAGDNATLARLIDGHPDVQVALDRFLEAHPEISGVLDSATSE